MSKLREYLCIEAKTIERKDVLGYRFTSATKSAPEATMESVYLKSEVDAVIAELQSDYKEACDRLQTANLIKDEQLAATRHQKYKRCLAMADMNWWQANRYSAAEMAKRIRGLFEEAIKCSKFEEKYLKRYHKWLELAEKFKEVSK